MTPLQLCYPVVTLEGSQLLSAGTHLTQETMEALVCAAGKENYPSVRFSEYGTVMRDLRGICERPPYDRIFSDSLRKEDIFNTIARVELVQPLVDVYGYFKTNDPYTYRHILTVFALSLYLAQELSESPEEYTREVAAATSHDFGKICVPISILKKTDRLDSREQQLLSHHTMAGYVLLSYYLKDPHHPAAITARDHHERRDGSGYPGGVAYHNRMVEIVATSDVFDALISNRPYRRQAYEMRSALEELTLQAEKGALDADILHTLIRCYRKEQLSKEESEFSHEIRSAAPPENSYSGASPCRFDSDCTPEVDQENR